MKRTWLSALVLLFLLGLLLHTPAVQAHSHLMTAFCEANFSVFVITYNNLPPGSLIEYQVFRGVDGSLLTSGSFTNTLTDHFYSTSEKGGVGTYQVQVSVPSLDSVDTFTTSCNQHWDVQGGQIGAFCEASFNQFVITYSGVTVGLTFNYTIHSPSGTVLHSGSFTNSDSSNFYSAGTGSPGANTITISLSTGESRTLTELYCPGGGSGGGTMPLPPGVEEMEITPAATVFEQETGLIDTYGNCTGYDCVLIGSFDPLLLSELANLEFIEIASERAGGWHLRVYYLGLDANEGIARVYQLNIYDNTNALRDDRTLIFAYPDGEINLHRR